MLQQIARCPRCSESITLDDRLGAVRVGNYVQVSVACPSCKRAGSIKVPTNEWGDWLTKAKSEEKETDVHAVDRRIGREVAFFRDSDLKHVETLDDLLLWWDAQELHEPWSIPKER